MHFIWKILTLFLDGSFDMNKVLEFGALLASGGQVDQ